MKGMFIVDRAIKGKVYKVGDNITAYKIISQERWIECGTDINELGKWTFEPLIPGIISIPYGFRNMDYKIVVGGIDFGGGGKSNDHPVLALKGAGVKLLISESFSRIFYRNAINLGLPSIRCHGISEFVSENDELSVDLINGVITNNTTDRVIKGEPLNDFILRIIEAGGLLSYHRIHSW